MHRAAASVGRWATSPPTAAVRARARVCRLRVRVVTRPMVTRTHTGTAKKKQGLFDERGQAVQRPYIWFHTSRLRECLSYELRVTGTPFPFDPERAIDDWVFMCFFVGNDFLPHLPSLEIREGAIDTLIEIYKRILPKLDGYLTENGHVRGVGVCVRVCVWV